MTAAKIPARWVMREALCLSFYRSEWDATPAMRRTICDDMARDALAAMTQAGFAVVPVATIEDAYGRFKRLTSMGQATMAEWAAMPSEVADLRRKIFGEADFGALHMGNLLRAAQSPATIRARDEGAAS